MEQQTEKITEEGRKELEARYDVLIHKVKPEIQAKLQAARELGDLSENADYDAALNSLQTTENEINSIKWTLDHAEIVQSVSTGSLVTLGGAPVTFLDMRNGSEKTFSIVGQAEADLAKGKVSNISPIAQALLGKKVGDVVTVHVAHSYQVKIVAVGNKR